MAGALTDPSIKLTIGGRTFQTSSITNAILSNNKKCVVIEYQRDFPEIIDSTQIFDDLTLTEKLAIYIIAAIEHTKGWEMLSSLHLSISLN